MTFQRSLPGIVEGVPLPAVGVFAVGGVVTGMDPAAVVTHSVQVVQHPFPS